MSQLSRKLFLVFLHFIIILIGLAHSNAEPPRLVIFPTESKQPKPVGKSFFLTCQADVPDVGLVTDLQWRDIFNNTVQPKPSGPNLAPIYTDILPGGSRLSLMIPSLTEAMAGMYYCTASYANTNFLSAAVEIETFVQITFKDAPIYQYPTLGDDYVVRCEVSARPSPTIDWTRNGDQLQNGPRHVIETHGLRIRNIMESDDGIYTCRAAVIQTGELQERNIRVEVQIKPEVQPLPDAVDAVETQAFRFRCNSTGKPVPRFTWIRDRDQQNVEHIDRFHVDPQTGLLQISSVEPLDYGKYTCRAENNASLSEKSMLLNVLVRPRIYELINITTAVTREALIICKASGRPPPDITFRRWGSQEEMSPGPQINDGRLILEQLFDNERGESNGTLRIEPVVRSDDGLYECVARNRGETAYKVGHIAVEFPPSFESMKHLPPVFTWEERRANLSCLAESIPNATIEWRRDERRIIDLKDVNLEIVNDFPRSDLLITPRGMHYYGAYKCIARNRHGEAETVMQLREARIPNAIPSAKPITVTATSIAFEILMPATEFGLPIRAIHCEFKEEFGQEWNQAANRTWSPDSPYVVEGLRPQVSYNFRFLARNVVGKGTWGAYLTQSTPRRSAPEEPRALHAPVQDGSGEDGDPIVRSAYADHFELRWSVPNDNGEPIQSYEIKYCPGQKINGAFSEVDSLCTSRSTYPSETSFDLVGLQPDTYYRIELKANNRIGSSRPAHLLVKTARGLDVIVHPDATVISSGVIIAIAVVSVLIILIIIDVLCCIISNCGITASICRQKKRSPSDFDEEKLGRDENQPLNISNQHSNGGSSVLKHNSSVEFDGRVTHSRSGDIIGKNSSV